MLLALAPLACVRATILPPESAKAIFLVVQIFAIVSTTVRPLHFTLASHFSVQPLSGVCASIAPLVGAEPIKSVVLELTFVAITVRPLSTTLASLFTFDILADEARLVGPHFEATAVLLVVSPEAAMQGTVGVPVRAETVCLVIAPLALVLVTICVNQSTVAIHSVANDVSFVQAAIGPDQHAISLTYQLIVNDAPLSTVALPGRKDLQLA